MRSGLNGVSEGDYIIKRNEKHVWFITDLPDWNQSGSVEWEEVHVCAHTKNRKDYQISLTQDFEDVWIRWVLLYRNPPWPPGVDEDEDTIWTEYENPPQDTDGNGTPDYLDPDDDGDTVNTKYENPDYNQDGNPRDSEDTDGNGTPNYLDPDDDGDSVLTEFEGPDWNGDGNPADAINTDGDIYKDYLDKDDDNDGVMTIAENPDPNGDGNPSDAQDSNGDGIPDYLDPATAIMPPPSEPMNPSPLNGEENVTTTINLDWNDCDHAASYDVYFDTVYPPSFLGVTSDSYYELPKLEYNISYYWKIVAKNQSGETQGQDWQFSTKKADFFIPFGSIGNVNLNGNINIANISSLPANVTLRVYDNEGNKAANDSNFIIPPNGIVTSWDEIGNIYNYGKPVTVGLRSDRTTVAEKRIWADDFFPAQDYDHVGLGMTCGPVEVMEGISFHFTFSTFTSTAAFCTISIKGNEPTYVEIYVYDSDGVLKLTTGLTIPGKGIRSSWNYIGSIQNIANPALISVYSYDDVMVDVLHVEQYRKGYGFSALPSKISEGTHLFIPFGSIGNVNLNGKLNIANISTLTADVTIQIYDQDGIQIGSDLSFSIPPNGILASWDEIGNIYDYGKPVTVEVSSDYPVVVDKFIWADDFLPAQDYDHIGIGMTCLPFDAEKGRQLYTTFSTPTSTTAYYNIINVEDSQAYVTIDVYDAAGNLERTESFTIPAKGIRRSWDYIGSIQDIANPATIKITSDKNIIVDAIHLEQYMKGYGFNIFPITLK
jgi:hypothetical protein